VTFGLRMEAERVVRALRNAGYEAYFAGGCVRDMVMDMDPHDYDIATNAEPDQVSELFPGKSYSVGAAFGVVVIRTEVAAFEVATFRRDAASSDGRRPDSVEFCSAEEDVFRRDFTINGMLYDPIEDRVLDWVGGRNDIKRRVIRAIGDPDTRFEEDKLRLMRAVRFSSRFNYAIEPSTYAAIMRLASKLTVVSVERLRDELVRILTGPNAGRAIRIMHDTGLLAAVLPEADAMAGVEQPPQFHPEGDVLEHTCLMLDDMRNPSNELAVAVLLHDVGKPSTMRIAERIRFDEHDRVGEAMTQDICLRLRFSRAQTDQIASLVGSHMRFMAVQRMKLSTLKRLLSLPKFTDHLELHRLDCTASHGKLDNYEFLLRKCEELSREEIDPPPLLTGIDLIKRGYQPGPRFSQILGALREEQLEGRVLTQDEAEAWLSATFPLGVNGGESCRVPKEQKGDNVDASGFAENGS